MSEIKVDTLTGKTTAKTVTVTVGATVTQSLEKGLSKCWVNFDGTVDSDPATLAGVAESLNVSSLFDVSQGRYYANLVNNFTNADFARTVSSRAQSYNAALDANYVGSDKVSMAVRQDTGAYVDVAINCIICQGDLA